MAKHHASCGKRDDTKLEGSLSILRQRLVDVGVSQADATDESVRLWSLGHGLVSLHLSGRLAFLDTEFRDFYLQQTRIYLAQLRARLGSQAVTNRS